MATDAAKAVLFEWHEKFLADATPKRVALGLPPLKPTGWTHKPAWDAEKKRLTMGVRVAEDRERAEPSKDVLYYQTVLYGPDNRFLTVRAVTSVGNWDKPVEEMKKLVGEFAFPKGDADADAESAVVHYGKIGGAGLVGVLVAFFGARALLGGSSKRRPSPTQSRPTARKFGSPR